MKKVKRFLLSCIGPSGSLNNDKFLQGMLQLRNTPDPDCKLLQAQIIFGHRLRDAFSFVNRSVQFENQAVHPVWREAWEAKETALRARFVRSVESTRSHSKLPKLSIGNRVFVQNQNGTHPTKWDRFGVIVECNNHDQYLVKMDGTGRLSLRNRKFLRQYSLPSSVQMHSTHHMVETGLSFTDNLSDIPKSRAEPIPTQGRDQSFSTPLHQSDDDHPENLVNKESFTKKVHTNGVQLGQRKADVVYTSDEQLELGPNTLPPVQPIPALEGAPGMPIVPADDTEDLSVNGRPMRVRRRPKIFIPETGKWSM